MEQSRIKKLSQSARLAVAGLCAVVAVIGVAAASDSFVAQDAAAAPISDACEVCREQSDNCDLFCSEESGEDAINNTAQNVLEALVWFGILLTVVFIVIGSIKIATSGGDQAKVIKGRNTIIFAVIGIVLVFLAKVIVDLVANNFTNP